MSEPPKLSAELDDYQRGMSERTGRRTEPIQGKCEQPENGQFFSGERSVGESPKPVGPRGMSENGRLQSRPD
jgi:hypothetical protein